MQSTTQCLLLLCLTALGLSEDRDKRHLYQWGPSPNEQYIFDVGSALADETAAYQDQAYLEHQAYYDSQVQYNDNHQNCDDPAHQHTQTIVYPVAQPVAPISYPVVYVEPEYYPVADSVIQPCPDAEVIDAPENIAVAEFFPEVEIAHQTYPEGDIVIEAASVAPPCPHAETVVEEGEIVSEPVVELAVPEPSPVTEPETIALPCPHAKLVHKVVETGPTEATIALVSKQEQPKISVKNAVHNLLQTRILNVGTVFIPGAIPKIPSTPSVTTHEEVPRPTVSVHFEQEHTTIPPPQPSTIKPTIVIQKIEHDIKPIREHILDHPSSGSYAYHQINKDNTVTTTSVEKKKPCVKAQSDYNGNTKKPCEKLTSTTPASTVSKNVAFVYPSKEIATGSYAYHQVNQDGTITSYLNNVKPESRIVNILPKVNKGEEVSINSQAPHDIRPVIDEVNEKGLSGVGGYVYNQINKDGTVTTYSQGNKVETISGNVKIPSPGIAVQENTLKPATIIKEGNHSPQKSSNTDEGSVYYQINQDGTVTAYSNVETLAGNVNSRPSTERELFYERSTLVPASIVTEVNSGLSETGGYTYHQINQDAALSSFSKGSHFETQSVISSTPAAIVNEIYGKAINTVGGYVYNQYNQDGTIIANSQGSTDDTISENVNAPSSVPSKVPTKSAPIVEKAEPIIHQIDQKSLNSAGGYAYHQVNQDGTVTSFSGGNNVETESANLRIPPQIVIKEHLSFVSSTSPPEAEKIQIINKGSPGSYIYHQSHNDGTVTTYSRGNVEEQTKQSAGNKVVCTKKPCVQSLQIESNGNIEINKHEPIAEAPRLSQLISDKSIGGYSYRQVHSGGLSVTSNGTPAPEFESTTPSFGTLVIGRIHKIIDTVPNGKLPIDEENNRSAGFDADRTNYSYKQYYADGTEQTFLASEDIDTESHTILKAGESTAKAVYGSHSIKVTDRPSTYEVLREDSADKSSTASESGSNVLISLDPESKKISINDLPETKSPFTTKYIYRQVVRGVPEKNYTVVNIDQSYNPPMKEPLASARVESLKSNPIVVPENSAYRFKQIRADGSAFSVHRERKGTSVVVTEDTNDRRRGDIGSLNY